MEHYIYELLFVLYILYFIFKHLKCSEFDKIVSAIQFENEEPMNTLKKDKILCFCNISCTFE